MFGKLTRAQQRRLYNTLAEAENRCYRKASFRFATGDFLGGDDLYRVGADIHELTRELYNELYWLP